MESRLAYRARQFRNALLDPREHTDTPTIPPYLSPTQLVLFRRMQPSEQSHACCVLEQLRAAGQTDPRLLAAALLHDVGKILYPLSPFERVMIVVGKRFFPRAARRWGQGKPTGLRRAFVVAAHHAEWGADLAAQAGASTRTVELIRHHQDTPTADPERHTDLLLAALQAADDEN